MPIPVFEGEVMGRFCKGSSSLATDAARAECVLNVPAPPAPLALGARVGTCDARLGGSGAKVTG